MVWEIKWPPCLFPLTPAQRVASQRATLRKTCRCCSLLHPERMEITQPRVARNELPWGVGGPLNLNPERVLSKTLNRYPRCRRGQGRGGLSNFSRNLLTSRDSLIK